MPKGRTVYDLSRTIKEDHYRWPTKIESYREELTGRNFTTSRISLRSHCFTHIDSFRHTIPDAPSIDMMDIERFVGEGYVGDLSQIGENQEITARDLQKFGNDVRKGDILILSTQWDTKVDFNSKAFWESAPYLTEDAARWILTKEPKAVGYDFPQDYEIRGQKNQSADRNLQWPFHELLPSHGIYQIEYLKIPEEILSRRVEIVALPLKLMNCDGSPARVICTI